MSDPASRARISSSVNCQPPGPAEDETRLADSQAMLNPPRKAGADVTTPLLWGDLPVVMVTGDGEATGAARRRAAWTGQAMDRVRKEQLTYAVGSVSIFVRKTLKHKMAFVKRSSLGVPSSL